MTPYRGGSKPLPPEPPVALPKRVKHGSFRAYQHYKCRCKVCQTSRREYDKGKRQGRPRPVEGAYIRPLPSWVAHGRVNTYNYYGCRCWDCRDARYLYDQLLYNRKTARKEQGS